VGSSVLFSEGNIPLPTCHICLRLHFGRGSWFLHASLPGFLDRFWTPATASTATYLGGGQATSRKPPHTRWRARWASDGCAVPRPRAAPPFYYIHRSMRATYAADTYNAAGAIASPHAYVCRFNIFLLDLAFQFADGYISLHSCHYCGAARAAINVMRQDMGGAYARHPPYTLHTRTARRTRANAATICGIPARQHRTGRLQTRRWRSRKVTQRWARLRTCQPRLCNVTVNVAFTRPFASYFAGELPYRHPAYVGDAYGRRFGVVAAARDCRGG